MVNNSLDRVLAVSGVLRPRRRGRGPLDAGLWTWAYYLLKSWWQEVRKILARNFSRRWRREKARWVVRKVCGGERLSLKRVEDKGESREEEQLLSGTGAERSAA